jgi:N-acetylglucosaminyldiphosphoundecaprenol N-acetyl-beta-D-mannosaminyltransferase
MLARVLGHRVPQQFNLNTWLPRLWDLASNKHYTVFLLGWWPIILEVRAYDLRRAFYTLDIVGTHHGKFNTQPGSTESEKVIRMINEVRPSILFTSFGTPRQEQWLHAHWDRLKVNVAIIGDGLIGEVGSFDLLGITGMDP